MQKVERSQRSVDKMAGSEVVVVVENKLTQTRKTYVSSFLSKANGGHLQKKICRWAEE